MRSDEVKVDDTSLIISRALWKPVFNVEDIIHQDDINNDINISYSSAFEYRYRAKHYLPTPKALLVFLLEKKEISASTAAIH